MAIRTTNNEIKRNYSKIYRGGYCDFQVFFNNSSADFYTCGIYGWNANFHKITNKSGYPVILCSGYRSLIGEELPEKSKAILKKANKIYNNYDLSYDDRHAKIERLKKQFINSL